MHKGVASSGIYSEVWYKVRLFFTSSFYNQECLPHTRPWARLEDVGYQPVAPDSKAGGYEQTQSTMIMLSYTELYFSGCAMILILS